MPQDAFTFNTSKKINPKKWRLKDKYIPNISHDLGSHLIAITSYLLTEYPVNVMCNIFRAVFQKISRQWLVLGKFKSNIEGTYWISKSTQG